MPRPRQVTSARMLEVARESFLEAGPAVSTAVIAERIGVSQSALFKRFGSKEALMIEALRPPMPPPWVGLLGRDFDARPFPEQLSEVAASVYEFLTEMVPAMSVLRSAGIHPRDLWPKRGGHPASEPVRHFAGWLRRAQAEGMIGDVSADALAGALLGALHSRAFSHHLAAPDPDTLAEDDAFIRALVDTLWRGARSGGER